MIAPLPTETKLAGLRYNTGKPKISMVLEATKAIAGCANVLEKGAEKYARNNWKRGLAISGIIDSMQRHVASYLAGEDNDKETGLPHVDHILCNALFISELYHTKKDLCDDRSKE